MSAERPGRPARRGLWLSMFAGLGLLAAMFLLDWFGPDAVTESGFEQAEQIQEQFGGLDVLRPESLEENAWQALSLGRLVLLAAGLSAIGLTFVRLAQTAPFTRLRAAAVATALGIASLAVVLYHLVNPPDDASREIGVYVGLLTAAALALSGWVALKDEELQTRRGALRAAGDAGRGEVSSRSDPPAGERSARRRRSRSSSG